MSETPTPSPSSVTLVPASAPSLARRFFIWKSRPKAFIALIGLLVEIVAFAPLIGIAPGPLADLGTPPIWLVVVLHVIGSAFCGMAFPGWYDPRPGGWAIPVTDDQPALALMETPQADFVVREMGQGAAGAEQIARAPLEADLRRPTHRLGPMMMGTALCFPVLGAATVTFVALVRSVRLEKYAEVIRHYRELVDATFPVLDVPPDVRESVVERTWAALELRPFVEIIENQTGEDEVAVSAIESTSALDYPVATRLLRHALASAIPETRYYAAKALARIEETLDSELQEAQEAHKRRPADPLPMMRIADARLSYGEVGQADDPLNRFHLTEAIKYYGKCLNKLEPALKDDCIARLAQACLRAGQSADAQRYYSMLVDKGSKIVSVLKGCIEACYANNDYEKVRHYTQVALLRVPDSDLLKEVARAWLEPRPSR